MRGEHQRGKSSVEMNTLEKGAGPPEMQPFSHSAHLQAQKKGKLLLSTTLQVGNSRDL